MLQLLGHIGELLVTRWTREHLKEHGQIEDGIGTYAFVVRTGR